MSKRVVELDVKFRFCSYDKKTLTTSIQDIYADNKYSFNQYLDLMSAIEELSFDAYNVSGIVLSTTDKDEFNLDENYNYEAEGKLTLEGETSHSWDGDSETNLYGNLKVTKYTQCEQILERDPIIKKNFKDRKIDIEHEKSQNKLEVTQLSEDKLFISIHANHLNRKRILTLNEFCDFFEVYLDYKNVDEVKALLKLNNPNIKFNSI